MYLAPDGELSLIPWNALPLPNQSGRLIEQFAIATIPYGQFLLQTLRSSRSAQEQGRMLAVGDLDYGQRDTEQDDRKTGLKRLHWSPLVASRSELESLTTKAGGREVIQLSGSDATIKAVTETLPSCRWAHFATHGFFVDRNLHQTLELTAPIHPSGRLATSHSRTSLLQRNPFLRSGLALSGANLLGTLDEYGVPEEATGVLTAEAIAAVDCRNLELVVLSACESGRGDVVHGDGVFGLQTAFHVAGARNIVASLWKIDDAATAELMDDFYRALWLDGQSPLEALRRAQLTALARSRSRDAALRGPRLSQTVRLPVRQADATGNVYSQLRYWAGFTLSGPGD